MTPEAFSAILVHLAEGTSPRDFDRNLAEASRDWPFCPVPVLERLGNVVSDQDELKALRERLAVITSSPRTLAYAGCGESWSAFYPPVPDGNPQRTDDVIDVFLRTYGSCTPEEEKMLEKMIFNPTPDYAEMLAREEQENLPEEEAAPGSREARINAFILSQHPAAQKAPPEPAPEPGPVEKIKPVERHEPTGDSLLSESLARIFIKQGRYERAFEIISGLSLKFPKKSAYFADQLRFLQKLIINQQRLQAGNSGDARQK